MRYDVEFSIGAERAFRQALAELNARVTSAAASRIDPASLAEDLLDDLDTEGPIFGPFFRSLGSSAGMASVTAARQGMAMVHAEEDREASRLLRRFGLQGATSTAVANADPALAEEIEEITDEVIFYRWVAALQNTCPYCLPLHGVVRSAAEWKRQGLEPGGPVHTANGIRAPCYCRWVPEDVAETAEQREILGPLYRVKVEKGVKRTSRQVIGVDLNKARQAAQRAAESKEGRRMLRKLGQAAKESA